MAKQRSAQDIEIPAKPAPAETLPAVHQDDFDPFSRRDQVYRVAASFDIASQEGAIRLSRILNAPTLRKEAWPQRKFVAQDVVYHRIAVAPKNGGPEEVRTRAILVGPHDELAGFQSVGVLSSLKTIYAQFGPPPWIPALVVEWDQIPAAAGHVAKIYVVGRAEA